jgi:parvulin-like peptidyl-prolyl isomerase
LLLLLGLALGLGGCPAKPETRVVEPKVAPTPKKPDPAVADIVLDESIPDDPSRAPKRPATVPPQVAVRHILVAYSGAAGAAKVTRTQAAAARRAARLVQVARKEGADFVALARKFSDVPRAERGALISISPGTMPRAFDAAAFGMGVGQVSDAVETKRGYFVVLRAELEEYSSAHILVQYQGALSAPVAITRTKDEARKKAEVVHDQATKGDANFAVLAERSSDSPSRIRGGALRPMIPGQMPAEYDRYIAALRELKVGEVGPVVETPFGFHVIKRLKLERIRASHILISYTGSEGTPRAERSKRDAEVLARKVWRETQTSGADFAALARQYSDHAESADKGGDLGSFARGTMPPRFEQIAFSLKVGQISDIVGTSLGFHIILRTQ